MFYVLHSYSSFQSSLNTQHTQILIIISHYESQKYTKLFDANGLKGGSFYLQSKIYRAKEALDTELLEETKKDEKKTVDPKTPK
jgi:hypothetical protein